MNTGYLNTLLFGIKFDGRKRSEKSRIFLVYLRKLFTKNQVDNGSIVVNLLLLRK